MRFLLPLILLFAPLSLGSVEELSESNFAQTSEGVWLVAFYSPNCGHCTASTPMFMQMIETAGSHQDLASVRFGAVDCSQESSLCQRMNIQGYPAVKGFVGGNPTDYNGAREVEPIMEFLKQLTKGRGGLRKQIDDLLGGRSKRSSSSRNSSSSRSSPKSSSSSKSNLSRSSSSSSRRSRSQNSRVSNSF